MRRAKQLPPADQPEFFSRRVRAARRYYLDLSPPENVELAVVCGGYEECASNYRVKRDDFPYYVLEWVTRGMGRVSLSGAEHRILKGALFCYGPGIDHDIETDAARPLAKHFVSFVGRSSEQLLRQASLPPGTMIRVPPGLDLSWLFESLRRDGQSGDARAAELCNTLLRYLLVKLAETSCDPTKGDQGAHATFVRCDDFLVEHARGLSSLAQLAVECGIDETYLCRLYKRFSSESPYQRLRRLKMNLAAEELAESDSSIHTVALTFGFSDPFHFSRTFKSVFGITPSAFRRLH